MKEDRSKQVESSISFLGLVLQPPDREQIQFLSTLTGLGPRGRGVEPSGAKGVDSVFQWFNLISKGRYWVHGSPDHQIGWANTVNQAVSGTHRGSDKLKANYSQVFQPQDSPFC